MSDDQKLSTERDARNSIDSASTATNASGTHARNSVDTATAATTRTSVISGVSVNLTLSPNPPDETDFEAADNFSTMVTLTSDVKTYPHRKAELVDFYPNKEKHPSIFTKVPTYIEYSIDGFSFHMMRPIKHGSIGVVMKATNDTDGNQNKIAVKFTDDFKKNAALSKEIKILRKFGKDESAKEYFPVFYCYVYTEDFMCSVMELLNKPLDNHIQKDLHDNPISLHLIRSWLRQMCEAVGVLRSYNVRNPSLSTHNFMLAGDFVKSSRIVMIHLHDSIVTRTSTYTPDFKNLKTTEFTPIEVLLKANNVSRDKMEEYSIAMIAMRLLTNKPFANIRTDKDLRMHILFKLLGDAPIEYKKVTKQWYEKTASGEWERNLKFREKHDLFEGGRKEMGLPSSFEDMAKFYPNFYSTNEEKQDLESLVHVIMVMLKYLPADRESIANVLEKPFFTLHGYSNETYNTTARYVLIKDPETLKALYNDLNAKNAKIAEAK